MDETLPALVAALESELRKRAERRGWSTVANPDTDSDGHDLGLDHVLRALPTRSQATPCAGTSRFP